MLGRLSPGGGSAQLPCFCVGGRAFCVSSPQTRQANSELRQRRSRPQKYTTTSSEWGLSGPACSALLRSARVGSSGGGGDLEMGSPAAWRSKKRKGNQPGLNINPSRAEQQQRCVWGTVSTVAAHLQGPPLRRNAPAGNRAAAVHRRPRIEATQIPRSPPSMTWQ